VVAEVGVKPDDDQIYRITFDGSVSDEPGFVAFGGQADQVAALLKERFHDDMTLTEALGAALEALAAPPAQGSGSSSGSAAGNGAQATELNAAHLEVAILDRARAHRTFRRLRGPRLEELLAESRAASGAAEAPDSASDAPAAQAAEATPPASDEPPTGPSSVGGDGIPKP
jgi:proteasome alpha subunit